jgi:hypothetical protein
MLTQTVIVIYHIVLDLMIFMIMLVKIIIGRQLRRQLQDTMI